MSEANGTQPANVVNTDYLTVPEIHVDGLGGISVRNGVAKLNFFSIRRTRTGVEEPQGVLTVTISLADLIGMTGGLNSAVGQLQSQGVISVVPTQEPAQQGEQQNHHQDWPQG